MITHRCLNDLFAYCDGTPKEGDKPTTSIVGLGNGCTEDISKCGHYVKASEMPAMPAKKGVKK